MLKEVIKKVTDLRVKVYSGKNVESIETDLEEIEQTLGKLQDQVNELGLQSVSNSLCYCGGNERIALDCTMKPCKHPKYYKKSCDNFIIDPTTSSATKCICGKQKHEHIF